MNGSLKEFMKSSSSIIIAVRRRESPTVEWAAEDLNKTYVHNVIPMEYKLRFERP